MGLVVEEGVALELRHHEEQSWPQDPKSSSNDRNVENDGHWQDEDGDVGRVVGGA